VDDRDFVAHVWECCLVDEDLARAAASIAAFGARPSFRFTKPELVDAIRDLHAVTSAATGALAGLVHDAIGWELPKEYAATSAVTWLRDLLRVTPADARTLTGLGGLLAARPRLADAVTSGVVNVSQAAVIGQVLDDVPDADGDSGVDPSLVDRIEVELVGHAPRFEPRYLRQLGQRILAHVNPELADRQLRERLEREERHARARRGFTMSPDGFGGIRLFGRLDVEAAATITAAISPLTTPITDADGPDLRSAGARRADALVDVCRLALRSGDVPAEGGQPAQVTVTIDWDALSRDVAMGHLDTGATLTPGAARRLACDAGILPVVLNGASVPIDVGRSRRPFTGSARQAVLIRDGGCAFPGCDRPSRWCDVHHVIFWSAGGSTDRDNGVALCSYHHRLIHRPDAGWRLVMASDHRPDFIPPSHIDPKQRPRRNPYHPRT
jgi:Domain of unknown function (DUF222)/HNH endonuclease